MLTVLSLFRGCGGLDLGFVQAGFTITQAFDNYPAAVRTYAANQKLLGGAIDCKSLALNDGEIRLGDLPRTDVVLGGPPCQGFSFAGKQFLDDPRNHLYKDFVEIVTALQPKVFLLENVLGMEAMALKDVTKAFGAAGYDISSNLALATDFGIAQRRQRLIVVGFRKDLMISFRPPSHIYGGLFGARGESMMVGAIGDLPRPFETKSDDAGADSKLPKHLRNHCYRPPPDAVQKFVRHIPNGGYFRDAPYKTLPDRLRKIADDPIRYRSPRLFPKPDPLSPAQTVPADTNPSLGGVLAPDFTYSRSLPKPVETSTYKVDDVYPAPLPSRRFTPRESASLQSFPDDFEFSGSLSSQYNLIGNAVPVRMAKGFAEVIAAHLKRSE